jgi:hypothetical protein
MFTCKDAFSGNNIRAYRKGDSAYIVVTGPKGGHKFLIEVSKEDAEKIAKELDA